MLNFSDYPKASRVFYFFEEISKIPRASGNTAQIAEYLVSFAVERGLEHLRDEADNVVIRKPATPGYEGHAGVIFQGHTDMVPAVCGDCDFNFDTDSLRLYRDGDFLRAKGTTLGADDGIAIAYALAVLDSDTIAHPDFEAVFTSDEETGLIGAKALSADSVKGRLLINIDSDAEGIFTVGCAGGLRCDLTAQMSTEKAGGYLCSLSLSGLRGGHSGVEINKGRVNAIKKLGEILAQLGEVRLSVLHGGNADNAIAREASATFVCDGAVKDRLKSVCEEARAALVSLGECDAEIDYAYTDDSADVLSKKDSESIVSLINAMPSGVIAMSEDIEGLVETSQNMGIISLLDGKLSLAVSVRSAKSAEKRRAADNIAALAKEHGVAVREHSEYPAWEYKQVSALRPVACEVYEKMYGRAPEVIIIHAGLECGIFSDKIERLDSISLGPDNFDIHTPEERLSLSSAARVWEYLTELLRNL